MNVSQKAQKTQKFTIRTGTWVGTRRKMQTYFLRFLRFLRDILITTNY